MLSFLTKKKSLKTLIIINSIFVLGANMFSSLFALFVKEIGDGAIAVGSIWAIYTIFAGILAGLAVTVFIFLMIQPRKLL